MRRDEKWHGPRKRMVQLMVQGLWWMQAGGAFPLWHARACESNGIECGRRRWNGRSVSRWIGIQFVWSLGGCSCFVLSLRCLILVGSHASRHSPNGTLVGFGLTLIMCFRHMRDGVQRVSTHGSKVKRSTFPVWFSDMLTRVLLVIADEVMKWIE